MIEIPKDTRTGVTPEKLRAFASNLLTAARPFVDIAQGMRESASAWEADLRRLDGYIFDLKDERARLEKVRAALAQEIADREARDQALRLARQEIAVDDLLLAERDRLLDVIPECSAHGNRCIPHAIEWTLASINLERAADALLGWFRKGVDCSPPQNFTQNLRVARQGGPTWEEDHAPAAFETKSA